ncbi:MAG: ammonia-forming cytochrome c nitrite reductase subunit c552, partial [Deltaproteobacteria bacterium]|nr:ammonia-forming cytochrome c nitrite reductase subunit c552 [Deltaproteobacteria bacterium]
RKSQFYLDFVEAENSTGFHAPQEAARILAEAIDYSRQGQLSLLRPPAPPPVPVPEPEPVPAPAAAPAPAPAATP